MKTIADIMPHINIIQEIDDAPNRSRGDRRRAMSALVVDVHRELVAGRTVPGFTHVGPYTRLEGFVPALADALVAEHRNALEQRAQLADSMEADGGENGAKAAAILRAMNAPADSKAALLRARGGNFTGHQPHGQASDEVEAPPLTAKDEKEALQAALRCGFVKAGGELHQDMASRIIERAREEGRRALEEDRRIKEAEKRGFYQARDRAFHLILENQGRHPDTIKVSKAFLADLQRDIVHMNKEG